jgi:hypothetical protein
MSLYFARANGRRSEGKEDEKMAALSDEDVEELGDRSPRYVFTT